MKLDMNKLCIISIVSLQRLKNDIFSIEELYLSLYCVCIKLRWYILSIDVYVIYKIDLIKYILPKLFLRDQIDK